MGEIEEKVAGEITMSEHPGETIRKWREEFQTTLTELSLQMGVSPSVLSDYESGRRRSPGATSIRKIVKALLELDDRKGGNVRRRYQMGVPPEALIDLRDYDHDILLSKAMRGINGTNVTSLSVDRYIRGYTVIDGIKAVLSFSYPDYVKLYGWSSQRIVFFTEVKLGRSPMIAIRAHPLKPGAVVYVQAGRVDPLAIKIAELENIPLITTDLPVGKVCGIMSNLI
ncbi:MAG: helix-turn-helix domain-containing protein [Candidatus Thermoplasmatota archaeon]|jgi:putative transcriptional regulator|nr:helix-turn-helix domain-containing protein [Candidatus Thermoplasmatota archaeon]MCL5785849.1 helix-turn-helix domain-containing protein [Candidatus Thermoplasmatota archaeon]